MSWKEELISLPTELGNKFEKNGAKSDLSFFLLLVNKYYRSLEYTITIYKITFRNFQILFSHINTFS
jgi:hypothetical protein